MRDPVAIAQHRRRVLLTIIALLVGAAAIGVAATVWQWNLRTRGEDFIGSVLLLLLFSLTAAAGLAMWRRRHGGLILTLSVGSSGVGFALWMYVIWGWRWSTYASYLRDWAIFALIFSVGVAHFSLIGLARLRRRWEWVRHVARACAGLLV